MPSAPDTLLAPAPLAPATLPAPVSPLARVSRGEGAPVTLLIHGVAGSAAETRPYAAALPGTTVHGELRGHGSSPDLPPEGWDFPLLAADVRALADEVGATRAVGLSLGAGVLLRVASETPDRFRALVLAIPASIDEPRSDHATERLELLGPPIDAGDVDAVAKLLLAEVPAAWRDERVVRVAVRRRANQLASRKAPWPRSPDIRPVEDRRLLADVRCPVLLLAQEDDPLHPLDVAVELAAALPNARLEVLPAGTLTWSAGAQAADLLAAFLAEADPALLPEADPA
jgi:pimeloyl-ACP methyl ester carboxylesterase